MLFDSFNYVNEILTRMISRQLCTNMMSADEKRKSRMEVLAIFTATNRKPYNFSSEWHAQEVNEPLIS